LEKGVDYMGDVAEFEEDIEVHAAIARTLSPEAPYKLSLHSGSDKFSVRFSENFHLFRATPTGLWLSDELVNLFGVTERPTGENAQTIYDHLQEKLDSPVHSQRAGRDGRNERRGRAGDAVARR
jgi:hypothetical protein